MKKGWTENRWRKIARYRLGERVGEGEGMVELVERRGEGRNG